MIDFINNYLVPGLVLGSVYALGAVGVSMIYAILRFAHFAHGDLMSLGAYFALSGVAALGWTPVAALPFAIVGAIAAALLVDRAVYRPFRKSRPIVGVIASFGVALMLRSFIQLVWGVDVINYEQGIVPPLESLEPLRIQQKHLAIFGATFLLVAALHYLLTRTRIGKAMRAMSDDADLARVTGINVERVIVWTWVVGAALAAAAGVLAGIDSRLHPSLGWDLLLPMFAAAILGGLGRAYGAIAGGFVIGLMEEISTYPLTGDEPLVSPGYKSAVAFAVMVAMLIWRPQGLLRGRTL